MLDPWTRGGLPNFSPTHVTTSWSRLYIFDMHAGEIL